MPAKRRPRGNEGKGRPKGSKNKATLEGERELEQLRNLVKRRLEAMGAAQVENAVGLSECFIRDDHGKWTRLEDPDQIEAALNLGGRGVRIFTKVPNVTAFDVLLTRTYGKPTETHLIGNTDGERFIVEWGNRKSRG